MRDPSERLRYLWLNDSKKLTAKKRDELYDVILEGAVSVGIGMASPERIDEINILQATYEAMREAVSKLEVVPQLLSMMQSRFLRSPFRRFPLLREMQRVFPLQQQVLLQK